MADIHVFGDEGCKQQPNLFSNGVFYEDNPVGHVFPLFVLQIVLIVFTSHAIHLVLRPLKQPRVVSYMIGGILLGPTFPYLLTRVFTLFQYIFAFSGEAPKYEDIKAGYLDVVFRDEGISLLRTAAYLGLDLHFFMICVKTNPRQMLQFGKKAFVIAVSAVVVPLFILSLMKSLFKVQRGVVIEGIGSLLALDYIGMAVSMTTFPVVADILSELRLLNTELGRLTVAASMINDIGTSACLIIRALVRKCLRMRLSFLEAAHKMTGYVILIVLLVFVFDPWARWIVSRTPKGGRVWEGHILMIMLAACAMGAFSDAFLLSHWEGPVFMGLLIPDGPPLGTALVDRANFVPTELLLPLIFLNAGRWIDFTMINHPAVFVGLVLYMFAGYAAKVLAVMVPAIYWNISVRNAAMLGLMLNFNGLGQIANYMAYADQYSAKAFLLPQAYVAAIVSCMTMTVISSTLVAIFYDPLNGRHVMGCRTVQHLEPQAEFRLVASLLDGEPVSLLLDLVEASGGGEQRPMCVYVLHLTEIMGRASSSLIAHKNKKGSIDGRQMDRLHSVFINYEQLKEGGMVVVQPFTAISPYKTMHHDICSLVIEKNVHFVIVPFPRKETGANVEVHQAARSIIPNVLSQAPCSVGILVHHPITGFGQTVPLQYRYHIKILFWGGADDREALSFGGRMARHVAVTAVVLRFLPAVDREMDEDLLQDEDLFNEFKTEHAENERVAVEEVAASDVEEAVAVIKSTEKDYQLVIVGRRQAWNSLLTEGMDDWSESPELGVVGDILASSDFADSSFSVLVIQQYV
ncbi:hypothetical protein OPV22_031767 [Ensete ventricosum]|uniref:Cation/H+ exchanger domain-containing protein n=1 Tax=Ensete ventricosum TaxID=4639 RepID=A0AAV8P1I7_ENSVE|nr:hypothetical protein OPV22_031767 [Ensete ventricosum]